MSCRWPLLLLPLAGALFAADEQPWKDKRIAEWNEEDAKVILSDSPWVRSVTPTMDQNSGQGRGRRSGMGRGGGMGGRGIGIGIPGIGGMGGGRRGGMGYPGAGDPGMGAGRYPGGGYPSGGRYPGGGYPQDGAHSDSTQLPALKLRWESALPVREAELKAHETGAPMVDADHYAVAIYGIPNRMIDSDSGSSSDLLKKQATIKVSGKKDWKPSSVLIIQRDEGTVIVYLFSRTNEVTRSDNRLEFNARIGRMRVVRNFYPEEMILQGKMEL